MSKTTLAKPTLRHVISINDLTNQEIEAVFGLADHYLENLGDPRVTYRIARAASDAQGLILATLFYEPSTRTRLSFESAMLRLGGNVIVNSDPQTSSAAKGESLADSIRVISNYADAIVLRHPRDGAARLAAEYATVPVINGGDGGHEHPTQTLCDLYTLRRQKKKLRNLNVAVSGDLKGSRTIHSFVYALARFEANIILMPAQGMDLPKHVIHRLREEFKCQFKKEPAVPEATGIVDALYVTPNRPHQLSFIPDQRVDISLRTGTPGIDVIYVTRFQRERWQDASHSYVKIDVDFLKNKKYAKTQLLHPLPRVGELDVNLDSDRRAIYFEQAAYGVPVRMALIAHLLGLAKRSKIERFESGFAPNEFPLYSRPPEVGLRCINNNCIAHDEIEKPHVANKFTFHQSEPDSGPRLRCAWCETDVLDFVIARAKTKRYVTSKLMKANRHFALPSDAIIFSSPGEAEVAGYTPASRQGSSRRPRNQAIDP